MESNWFSKFDLYVIDEEEKTVAWVHENMVVLTASALMENVPKSGLDQDNAICDFQWPWVTHSQTQTTLKCVFM